MAVIARPESRLTGCWFRWAGDRPCHHRYLPDLRGYFPMHPEVAARERFLARSSGRAEQRGEVCHLVGKPAAASDLKIRDVNPPGSTLRLFSQPRGHGSLPAQGRLVRRQPHHENPKSVTYVPGLFCYPCSRLLSAILAQYPTCMTTARRMEGT